MPHHGRCGRRHDCCPGVLVSFPPFDVLQKEILRWPLRPAEPSPPSPDFLFGPVSNNRLFLSKFLIFRHWTSTFHDDYGLCLLWCTWIGIVWGKTTSTRTKKVITHHGAKSRWQALPRPEFRVSASICWLFYTKTLSFEKWYEDPLNSCWRKIYKWQMENDRD